jgi:uncharacterized protein YdeI (YjbR/CyaY-like superfamily)
LLLGGEVPDGTGGLLPANRADRVAKGMPAYDEELFGPVAAIIAPCGDERAAIRVANDSVFGLGAAVFTRDLVRGERIARSALEAGSCFVNARFVRPPVALRRHQGERLRSRAGPGGHPGIRQPEDGVPPVTPTFFTNRTAFGRWLAKHGAATTELWVGFYKKDSGRKGMTYREAVDEALCHGWIDGIIKRIDDVSYVHRFTPRKSRSFWSATNIAKVRKLEAAGRMTPAGRAAFDGHEARLAPYSHQQGPRELDPAHLKALKANRKAWTFWQRQPPSYWKVVAYWISSAKREATRERRLAQLVTCSAEGRRLPQFISPTG